MTCPTCNMNPGACMYIEALMSPENGALLDIADSMADVPQPHRDACPCPECWSSRAATWGSSWTGTCD